MDNSNYEVDRIFLNKVLGHKVVIPILDVDFVKDFWKGVRLIKADSINTLENREKFIMFNIYDLQDCLIEQNLCDFKIVNQNVINKIERKGITTLKMLPVIILLNNIVLGSSKFISDDDVILMRKYFGDDFTEYYLSNSTEHKFVAMLKLLKSIKLKDNIVLSNMQKRRLHLYNITDPNEILDYISSKK